MLRFRLVPCKRNNSFQKTAHKNIVPVGYDHTRKPMQLHHFTYKETHHRFIHGLSESCALGSAGWISTYYYFTTSTELLRVRRSNECPDIHIKWTIDAVRTSAFSLPTCQVIRVWLQRPNKSLSGVDNTKWILADDLMGFSFFSVFLYLLLSRRFCKVFLFSSLYVSPL